MRRAILTGAAVIAAMVPLACGNDDDSGSDADADQVRAALERVETSIREGDIPAFCRATAPSYVEDLGGQAECVKELKKDILFTSEGDPVAMEEDGIEFVEEGATVTLTNGFTVNFVEEGGEWYFSPFGKPGEPTATTPVPDPGDVAPPGG